MRCQWKIIGVLLVLSIASRANAQSPSTQILMKGQSTTLTFAYEIGDVAVADRQVCDYLVGQERRSLYLNARAAGETSVTLWDRDGAQRDEYVVRVVTTTLKEALARATGAFGDIAGVTVQIRDGRVEIDGAIADPEEFRRIEAMARKDPRLRSRVRITSDVVDEIAHAVRREVAVPGVTVRAVRDRVLLEGVAYSAADAKRAVEIARIYHPEILDLIEVRETGRRVGQGRMIALEFHLMEVKRTALKGLGVNWAPGAFPGGGGNASVGGGGGAGMLGAIGGLGRELIGFVFQLAPRLNFIRQRGQGRVLENPRMIVKSGETAKIFSGSEVPYYRGDEVQFKKVGVEIEAAPIEAADGVDVNLTLKLSAPSADIRGAVDTHTVATSALCRFGQSLVLGNIIRSGSVRMKNRVPSGVDASSALFTLFLSKDFQENRSEFIVFVTPRVLEMPDADEARLRDLLATEGDMVRNRAKTEYETYLDRLEGGDEANEAKRSRAKGRTSRRHHWE